MAESALNSVLSFIAVIALIPAALWLLKRSPLRGPVPATGMKLVAALSISPSQRIITVEVGSGEQRQWLVLGVTPQSITPLHSLAPQDSSNDAA